MESAFYQFLSLIEFKKNHQIKNSGLNYTQFQALTTLYKEKCTRTLEIAKILDLSPSTLNGVLDELEKLGLISRERNFLDKRVVLVAITKAGEAQAERLLREDMLFLKNLAAPLTEAEGEQFFSLLDKMVGHIENPEDLFKDTQI